MRIVIQRVSSSNVLINGTLKRSIDRGLMVLLGIEMADTTEDVDWLVSNSHLCFGG